MPLNKLSVKDIRPDKIVKKLYQLAEFCKRYHSPLSFKYYESIICYLRLRRRERFRHDEIFSLGLLSPSLKDEISDKFISQIKFNKSLKILNPVSNWWTLSGNKGIFYKFFESLNFPIPKLYAIFFREYLSVSYMTNSSLLIKKDNLIEFIENELPSDFVIKPLLGEAGASVNAYTKTDNGIIDGSGNLKTEQAIYDSIMHDKKYDSFIVQEKLKNHPYLLKITPSENLHTVRIITLVESSKQCRILNGHLNISTGRRITSQHGNLKINISLDDGILEYGILFDQDYGGFKKITQHPETGKNFNNFKLPLWEKIIALSKEAALKFLPMRTLGWDIALTEKGVIFLEANAGYYPPNYFEQMDKFVKTLLSS